MWIDNSASHHAIERGYSLNRIAGGAIEGTYKLAEDTFPCALIFRSIPGKKNPADEPSHNREVIERKGLRHNVQDVEDEDSDDEAGARCDALVSTFDDETGAAL